MDRKIPPIIMTMILALASFFAMGADKPQPLKATVPSIVVNFSPKGGITAADVAVIAAAEREILVQSYSFTSKPICEALIAAKNRGVDVQVVIDGPASQSKYCRAKDLALAQCQVRIATCRGIAHNKVMLVDGQTIITGSFNWTAQAETINQENQLILSGFPDLLKAYRANWEKCWSAGTPYVPPKPVKSKK